MPHRARPMTISSLPMRWTCCAARRRWPPSPRAPRADKAKTRANGDLRQQTGQAMKLYMHPISTVCRPIRLLCAENNIALDEEMVDLMVGAHTQGAFASLNPNQQVPLLVDGDLRLTEGSAI